MKKVLIIEDDTAIAELYRFVFLKRQYSVVIAYNGEQGIQALEQDIPDILLVDVMMPKMNGMQMLKYLKSHDKYKDIPVIVLSNLTEASTEQAMLREGAVTFVVKSQKLPDEIVNIVDQFFVEKNARP